VDGLQLSREGTTSFDLLLSLVCHLTKKKRRKKKRPERKAVEDSVKGKIELNQLTKNWKDSLCKEKTLKKERKRRKRAEFSRCVRLGGGRGEEGKKVSMKNRRRVNQMRVRSEKTILLDMFKRTRETRQFA